MNFELIRQRISTDTIRLIILRNNKYVISYMCFAPYIFDTHSASDDEQDEE